MMRVMVILWSMLAAGVGVSLFLLKHEVRSLEEELGDITRQIRTGDESIHVLKAEWSYLNDPGRLRRLAEAHLDLQPLKPEQITTAAASSMVLAAMERSMAENAARVATVSGRAPAGPSPAPAEKSAAHEKTTTTKPAATRPPLDIARPAKPTTITHAAGPAAVRGLAQVVSARSVQ